MKITASYDYGTWYITFCKLQTKKNLHGVCQNQECWGLDDIEGDFFRHCILFEDVLSILNMAINRYA
jgi:hypothetical protein